MEDDISAPIETPEIERLDSNTWRVQGSAPLDEVSQQIGIILPEDEYDTFGGLVFGILGTVPEDGSTPEVEDFGLLIKVVNIKEHRLESAIVHIVEHLKNPEGNQEIKD